MIPYGIGIRKWLMSQTSDSVRPWQDNENISACRTTLWQSVIVSYRIPVTYFARHRYQEERADGFWCTF